MKKSRILSALLLTTSLSSLSSGMENYLHTETSGFKSMDPSRSFGRQAFTNAVADTKQGLAQDMQELGDLLKKVANGEWESIAGVGIHQVMDHLNGQFLNRYNLPKNITKEKEFNSESLKPFLRAFREKATILLQGLVGKNGNAYAYNPETDEQYPIFNDTPFNQLADYFIPSFLPMRDLLISICSAGPVNDYLGNKLDELAIHYLLNTYKHRTGRTLKETGVSSLLNGLKAGYDVATADYEDYASLPTLAKENDKGYAPIFAYLEPRLNHLARTALQSLFLDAGQKTSEFILEQGLKKAFENSVVANGMKGATLALSGLSSQIGWYAGSLAGGFAGGLSAPCATVGALIGFGTAYKLEGYIGWYAGSLAGGFAGGLSAPCATVGALIGFGTAYKLEGYWPAVGGVVGAATGLCINSMGYGAPIGSWTGAAIAATAAFSGTYAVAPRLVTHVGKSLTKTTQEELNNQLQLFVDYYTHTFLPLTPEEHALYHLNPAPTDEEKAIYHQDYARREQLLSQSFAGEAIKQFIDLNGASFALALNGIADQYQAFVNYCLSSSDATTDEILQKAGLTGNASGQPEKTAEDWVWREFVVRTSDPRSITAQDKALLDNLKKFPSFKVRQNYLDQLSLFMNSLSTKNLQEFAKDFADRKDAQKGEKGHIQKIRQTVENAGNRVAELYQKATGNALGQESIDLINQSARALWKTATLTQLDRLVEALEDNDFIQKDFSKEIEAVIDEETDYLKVTLDEYISSRDEIYLKKDNNQGRFNALRNTSLTETLDDADVVGLLRKIDEVNFDNLPAAVKGILSGEKQEIDPVSLMEKQELNLIKERYESLLGRQFTALFMEAFQGEFKGAIEEIGKEILGVENALSKESLFQEIVSRVMSDKSFNVFMESLQDHPKSRLFSSATFSQIKGYIQKIAEDLVDILGVEKEFEVIQNSPFQEGLTSSGSYFSGWFSPAPIISQEVPETKEKASIGFKIEALKLYNQNDIGGFKLIQIINKLSEKGQVLYGKDLTNLEENEMRSIHQEIQNKKRESIIVESDLEFLNNYYSEIMEFKISSNKLENKLFYGYNELIQGIRQQNQQVLESLQNLKK